MIRPRISFGSISNDDMTMSTLRLIAIADFAPSDKREDPVGQLKRIDKDSFNEVLNAVCPGLRLHIINRNRPDLPPAVKEIPLTDLKSFHPASLIKNLESLRPLLQGRQAILDYRDGRIDREQFIQSVKALPQLQFSEQAEPSKPPASQVPTKVERVERDRSDTIDSILDMVETPTGIPVASEGLTEGAARVQRFISEMFADTHGVRALDAPTASAWLAQVDDSLSKTVAEILSNPEFRQKERAWRGLKFLVDRTDFREPIQLEILSAGKEHLVEVMEMLAEESDAVGPPVAAVVTDFEFDASAPDMELLRRASEVAERLQAILLVNLESRFFDRETAAEVSAISHLPSHLDAAEFVKWRGLREAECSRWLGACFNRLLMRRGYGDASSAKLGFAIEIKDDGLWGNPSWAVGSLLTRCFARTGWCGHITGLRGGGLMENLPLRAFALPSGTETQIPLETIFLKDREYDFYESGILVLQCGEDRDMAVLLQAPSVHQPEKYSEASETEVSRWRASLVYQLVAARFVRHLEAILGRLDPAASPEEMEQTITGGLSALLGDAVNSGAGVSAGLSASQERIGFLDLQLHIRPGPAIWSLPVDIELTIPVRKP